jgi:hypothetical protein
MQLLLQGCLLKIIKGYFNNLSVLNTIPRQVGLILIR